MFSHRLASAIRKSFFALSTLALVAVFATGCASSRMKQRREERNKVAQSSKFYCDFVNNEIHSDVEVQLNLEMAKKCDNEKPFSISGFKTSNENSGVMYCCSLDPHAKLGEEKADRSEKPKEDKKPEAKVP